MTALATITALHLLAQLQIPAALQSELFKTCADVFGFICDGKDLALTTVVPACHLLHKHLVAPILKTHASKH